MDKTIWTPPEPPELPGRASVLIKLALIDLQECEVDDGYVIDFEGEWYGPEESYFTVNFGGCVMALTLRGGHSKPLGYPTDTARKLLALELFRTGKVHKGLGQMGSPLPPLNVMNPVLNIFNYEKHPAEFYADMTTMACILADCGL